MMQERKRTQKEKLVESVVNTAAFYIKNDLLDFADRVISKRDLGVLLVTNIQTMERVIKEI